MKISLTNIKGGVLGVTAGYRLTSGTNAALLNNGVPAIIQNRYGKGEATLLNFIMDSQPRILTTILADYGISPDFSWRIVKGEKIHPTFYIFILGEDRYIGINTPYEDTIQKGEKVLEQGGTPWENLLFTLEMTMPKKTHVYDSRNGKYFGYKRQFQFDAVNGEAYFLAFLKKPVENLKIDVPAKVARGDACRVVIFRNPPSRGNGFCQLKIYRPDGSEYKLLRRVAGYDNNRAKTELPIAYNDPTGAWKIVARDASTGIQKESQFQVTSIP